MAKQVRWRRGTTAEVAAFTPALAEIIVDTTKKTAVVGDGSTAGGNPLATEAKSVAKTSPTGSAELPVGTTAQRDASPQKGYLRFNDDLDKPEVYNGTNWGSVGGGATGAGGDDVFNENSQTITTDYTITAGKSASSTGDITINSGVTVTIPSGSRWVII